MKQKPAKRGARAWAIAIPAGILLLLLLAAFLIGKGGASAFRDDVAAPLSGCIKTILTFLPTRAAFCPVSGGRCASGSAISISASA